MPYVIRCKQTGMFIQSNARTKGTYVPDVKEATRFNTEFQAKSVALEDEEVVSIDDIKKIGINTHMPQELKDMAMAYANANGGISLGAVVRIALRTLLEK